MRQYHNFEISSLLAVKICKLTIMEFNLLFKTTIDSYIIT